MRTFWNVLGFLAIVNLLAIAFVGAWLWQSGRVDRARIEGVRELFRLPVAEEEAARLAAESAAAEALVADELEVPWRAVPVTNLDGARARERLEDLALETSARLASDASLLMTRIEDTYRRREAELASWESRLEREEARMAEIQSRTEDADFRQVVADLGEMKLEVAYSILRVWLEEGRRTLVVDVLHALEPERRHDVLGEFVDAGRDQVAADLQLALRQRTALEAAAAENADATAPDSGTQPTRQPGSRPRQGTSSGAIDA